MYYYYYAQGGRIVYKNTYIYVSKCSQVIVLFFTPFISNYQPHSRVSI